MTSLDRLRREAAACRRCDLWKLGTQTVFGVGAFRDLMLVGEQPGDAEDRAGRPFVGPAGKLLRWGQRLELEGGTPALVTLHPSAVLRAQGEREARRVELLEDLELARATVDALIAGRVTRTR